MDRTKLNLRHIDAEVVRALIEQLFARPGGDAVATRALISPELALTFKLAPAHAPVLGPTSTHQTQTLLAACEGLRQLLESLDLDWAPPHVLRLGETSLVAACPDPDSPRTSVTETWIAEVEWELRYEPKEAGTEAVRKRYKLWRSGVRSVRLVLVSPPPVPAQEAAPTHPEPEGDTSAATLVAKAEQVPLTLVTVEYAFAPSLPRWVDRLGWLVPSTVTRFVCRSLGQMLYLVIAVLVWLCYAASDPSPAKPTTAATNYEAFSAPPPVHLRYHQRHYEPECQPEPEVQAPPSWIEETSGSGGDILGPRRRWSVSTASVKTPATASAAAHLHLERPLAERRGHWHPGSEEGNNGAAQPQEQQHVPAHAHPLHHPHHHHHHPHGPHAHPHPHPRASPGALPRLHHAVVRLFALPVGLLSLLVQVFQVIFFDFAAVSELIERVVSALVGAVQRVGGSGTMPEATQAPTQSRTPAQHGRRVSFAGPEVGEEPARRPFPLNPPPSPCLAPIREHSEAGLSLASPLALESTTPPFPYLPLEPGYPHPVDSHGAPIASGLVASLPIPLDVDAHALALHDQLAAEAAAAAARAARATEGHALHAPVERSPRELGLHDEVAKEATAIARSMEHVERMAGKFSAAGEPELGPLVEVETPSQERLEAAGGAEASTAGGGGGGEKAIQSGAPSSATLSLPARPHPPQPASVPPCIPCELSAERAERSGSGGAEEGIEPSDREARAEIEGRLGLIGPGGSLGEEKEHGAGAIVKPETPAVSRAAHEMESEREQPSGQREGAASAVAAGRSESAPRQAEAPLAVPAPGTSSSSNIPFGDGSIGAGGLRISSANPTIPTRLTPSPPGGSIGLGLGPSLRTKAFEGGGGVRRSPSEEEKGLRTRPELGQTWSYPPYPRRQEPREPEGGVAASKAGEQVESEGEGERSIDPAPARRIGAGHEPGILPISEPARQARPEAAAARREQESLSPPAPASSWSPSPGSGGSGGGSGSGSSPASVRMQHELSRSGPFLSSQGTPSPPSLLAGRSGVAGFSPPPALASRLSAPARLEEVSEPEPEPRTQALTGREGKEEQEMTEVAAMESQSPMSLAMLTRTPPPATLPEPEEEEEGEELQERAETVKPPAGATWFRGGPSGLGLEIHPAHGYDEALEARLGREQQEQLEREEAIGEPEAKEAKEAELAAVEREIAMGGEATSGEPATTAATASASQAAKGGESSPGKGKKGRHKKQHSGGRGRGGRGRK